MNGGKDRVRLGVDGLDAMLAGGVLVGDSTLVAGSPGTGKTTLGLHFLAAGVQAGEPGVMVTFEYLPQQIYRDSAKKGMPVQQWEKDGLVKLVCTTPEIMLAPGEKEGTVLDDLIRETKARRLVIDSMTHFEFAAQATPRLRPRIAGLMNHLRLLNVTSILTHEVPQIVGPAVVISSYGLEFLVDNIIMLRYVELESELQKAINVLKFRGGWHDRKYHILKLGDHGMTVEADFKGVEGISSGAARRSLGDRLSRMV